MRRGPGLRWFLLAIAVITLLSGLVQMIAPGVVLAFVAGGATPTSKHFFAIVGMFMALFGGALFQAVRGPSDQPVVEFWAGLQKFGATAAVAIGVARGLFQPQALLVAGFDFLSGILIALHWALIRRPAAAPARAPASIVPAPAPAPAPRALPTPVAAAPVATPADGRKRSLILAGGGMRVAYQAGVVRALYEEGLIFDHADGTSGGIMNLAMLLSGLSPVEMCQRWCTLDPKHFVSFVSWEQYLRADDMLAMGDADGLTGRVFPHLGIDVDRIRVSEGLQGTFNVCNFTDKTNEVVPHQQIDLDYLVAGVSLPIFLPPVARGDRTYTDAVWIRDANLMEAVRRGADELWVVWCIGNTPRYHTGAFRQYVHMIEMSANGALFEELARIEALNARILGGEIVWGHTRPIRLHVICPEYPLPLDPDYLKGHIDGRTLVAYGYADAWAYLRRRTDAGLPYDSNATRMSEPGQGFTFRETMEGAFALGETEPGAGERQGRAEGTTMVLHATITTHDLDRFITDDQHVASLAGYIDFTPFGVDMPIGCGTFNLFMPSDNPRSKHILYEACFKYQGQAYFVSGRKLIRDDPGFDLWTDSTRLFAKLHAGRDGTGPILGAGVLTLEVGQVIALVRSMCALGSESTADRATAIARFGRHFLGELWDTYVRHVPMVSDHAKSS